MHNKTSFNDTITLLYINKIDFNNNNNNNIIRDMKLILTTCLPIYSVPFPDVIKLNERV